MKKRNRRPTPSHEQGSQSLKLPRWRFIDWRIVALVFGVKVILIAYGVHAYAVLEDKWSVGWLEIWNRWDAPHYLDIARQGYVSTGLESRWIVFYPLYPWLVRIFAAVFRDYVLSAFFVSALTSVASALLLYRITALDHDDTTSRIAVVFMLIFPTSYFLHIGYTESLFLALALACFLAARRRVWWAAGVMGACAGLSRVNGLLLIPALVVEAYDQFRNEGRQWRREWAWIALCGAGFAIYLLLNRYALGDAFAFLRVQEEHWFRTFSWPWVSIAESWNSMGARQPSEASMVGWQELWFALLGAVCTVWCALKLRPSYAVWMGANWILWSSTRFLLSVPRYTLIMFPIYILFARTAVARPTVGAAIGIWSLLFLALFAAQFVRGHWAF